MSFLKKIAIVFLLIPFTALSQTIKGVLKDNTGVMPWANIILTDAEGNLILGDTSKEDGSFKMTTKKGSYKLTISFLGYIDFKKELSLTTNINLGEIILKEDSNKLDEVVLKVKKRLVERKVDRLVFNVEANLATKGTNALQILKVTPGVLINNKAVELLGKGASGIMINGRIVQLTGEELINYLNGISSEDILEIEVITNPPAKYEASGKGGLINIILKKGKQNSWRNSTTISQTKQYYKHATLRNNFFYNKNKIQFSTSLNATRGALRNLENLYIEYPNSPWEIDINTKGNKEAYSGRLSLDYDITNTFSLGVLYMGSKQNPGGFSITKSNILDANNNLYKYLLNEGDNKINAINHSVNLHSIIKLDTLGRSISFDADFFRYNYDTNRVFTTKDFDANTVFLKLSSSAISQSKQIIDNYSSKIDVNHPFKTIQLTYGAKYNRTISKSDLQYYDRLSGGVELDESRSNIFEYKENNTAFYVSVKKKFNSKWNTKIGLRLENTVTNGFSKNLNKRSEKKYTKPFPTLCLSYKNNENNQFIVSYGKRIERPRFDLLNPFRYYISDNSYSEGNPLLLPSFSNNFECSYSYKNKLNTSVSLSSIKNGFGVVFTTDTVNQIQVVTRENYFKQHNYKISESYVYTNSWLQSQNSISLLGYTSTFREGFNAIPKNGLQFIASINNTISVSDSSKIQINSWYSSAHNRGLFSINEMVNLSVGYQQSFLNKGLNLSIMMNDIFNSSKLTDYSSSVNGVTQHYAQDRGNRNLIISLTYNFGNNKIKTKNRNFGNDDERSRTN